MKQSTKNVRVTYRRNPRTGKYQRTSKTVNKTVHRGARKPTTRSIVAGIEDPKLRAQAVRDIETQETRRSVVRNASGNLANAITQVSANVAAGTAAKASNQANLAQNINGGATPAGNSRDDDTTEDNDRGDVF